MDTVYRYKTSVTLLVIMFAFNVAMVMADPTCSLSGNFFCNAGRCCSKFNWCGGTAQYCAKGNCIAQCWPGVSALTQILYFNIKKNKENAINAVTEIIMENGRIKLWKPKIA
ncbi:hypothetical protein KI387_040299, partial [Taxus chinensis]